MKIIDIEEQHKLLLEIAHEMHVILKRNNITYYMIGGSMLGAIRHQDIIPWDDDMDFGIPRSQFDLAINTLRSQLPKKFRVHTTEDSPRMLGDLCKIENSETLIEENDWKSHIKEDDFGVFVDIFPLDFSSGRTNFFSLFSFISFLKGIQNYRFLSIKPRPFGKKLLALLIKILLYPLKRTTITTVVRNIVHKTGDYYVNYYGIYGKKEMIPLSYFGKPTDYQIGNTKLYGVEKAHEYLSLVYGNYLQLPPKSKRKQHIKKIMYRNKN